MAPLVTVRVAPSAIVEVPLLLRIRELIVAEVMPVWAAVRRVLVPVVNALTVN